MLLKLEMPFVNPIIEEGIVESWHVQPGDSVAFGDVLCEIRIEQAVGIKRRIMAYQLMPGRKKQKENERGTKPVNALVSVKASDSGILRKIEREPGTDVKVGETLALFSTSADEPIDDGGDAAAFRAVGNIAESAEGAME